MKQNNKGITMVSLVVTIIVLIILAGVSINLTLGNDGIITKAKQAKENMEFAQVEEATRLNELYSEINSQGSGSSNYDAIIKLEEFKSAIATAITNQGVETSSNATAETMAANIGKIAQSNTTGTAIQSDILETKTAWVNGSKLTGTMSNNGELNWSPTTSTTYTIPAGYYSGGTLDSSGAYNAGYEAGTSQSNNDLYVIWYPYGDMTSWTAPKSGTIKVCVVVIGAHTSNNFCNISATFGGITAANSTYKGDTSVSRANAKAEGTIDVTEGTTYSVTTSTQGGTIDRYAVFFTYI